MSHKVVQLEMFRTERETFEDITIKSMKALFARDSIREKDMKNLKELIFEMHEIVLRLNDRVERVSQHL